MGVAPLLDDCEHLAVSAAVFVMGDATPRTDRSAKSAGEFGAFSELTFGGSDLADGSVLVQHAVSEHTIKVERLVAGRVEAPEGIELPSLAGEPCIDPAFDCAKISTNEHMPGSGAQRCARQFADHFERIAPVGKLGAVAGEQRVDQGAGKFVIVAGQVVQLCADR